MAEKRTPSYQDYEEAQWGIDTARNKFAPWLIVHCRRTETYYDSSDEGIGSATGTTTISLSTGSSYPDTLGGTPTTFSFHLGYLNAEYDEVQLNFNFGLSIPLYSLFGPHRITKGISRYNGEFTPVYQMFGESTLSDSLYYYAVMVLNMNEQPSDTAAPSIFDKSRFSVVNTVAKVASCTHTYSTTGTFNSQTISFPGAVRVTYNTGPGSNDGGVLFKNKDILNLSQGDFTIEGYHRQRDGGYSGMLVWNIMNDSAVYNGVNMLFNCKGAQGPGTDRAQEFTLFYSDPSGTATSTVMARVSTQTWVGTNIVNISPENYTESAYWTHWVVERQSDTVSVYVHGRLKGYVDVSNKNLNYTS